MIKIKALLCLHGLLSNNLALNNIYINLKDKYDYIHIPNLPGHGDNNLSFSKINVFKFTIEEFDKLSIKYKNIDVLGYSLGGVLACYIALYRNVNKLILLAPAFKYINIKKYKPKEIKINKEKKDFNLDYKKIKYFITFTKIVNEVNEKLSYLYIPVCIIYGDNDILVNEKGCFNLYKMVINKNKYYIKIKNVNHHNILSSLEANKIILKFLE